LGKFWKALEWNIFYGFWNIWQPFGISYCHLVYHIAIWYIILPFGISYCHLVYHIAIWYILWSFGTFCGHLVDLMAIWYILWPCGILCIPVLVCCTKTLATLEPTWYHFCF
jgi:hypothetical protein